MTLVVNDVGKLGVLLVALIGAFAGLLTGTIDDTTAVAIIGPIIGYVTGNGVLAARKQASSPVIASKGTTTVVVSDSDTTIVPPKVAD
jgi:hypothetical protein